MITEKLLSAQFLAMLLVRWISTMFWQYGSNLLAVIQWMIPAID